MPEQARPAPKTTTVPGVDMWYYWYGGWKHSLSPSHLGWHLRQLSQPFLFRSLWERRS